MLALSCAYIYIDIRHLENLEGKEEARVMLLSAAPCAFHIDLVLVYTHSVILVIQAI